MGKSYTDNADAMGHRLRHMLEQSGIERQGAGVYLEKKYGVSNVTANDWLNGKFKPNTTRARKLADDHGHNFDWLYFGVGPPEKGDAQDIRPGALEVLYSTESAEPPAGYIRLPLLDGEISAGSGAENSDEVEALRWLDIAEWWARKNLSGSLSQVRILTVRGDSMAPDIQDGDIVFVDSRIRQFETPAIYVLNWNGRALVKRLAPEISTGRLAIISKNSAYPTEYVTKDQAEELHISGRVLAWWTLKKF